MVFETIVSVVGIIVTIISIIVTMISIIQTTKKHRHQKSREYENFSVNSELL